MDGDTRCRVWCHDRIYVVEPLWLCNCVPPSSSYAYLQLGKSSGVVSFVGCFLPLFPECVWVVRGRNTLCQFCFRCSKCSMFRSNPIKEDSCVFLSRALYISVCFVTGRLLWRKRFKHGRMSIRAYGWPSFSWLHGGYIKVHGSRKSPDLSCNNKISITTTDYFLLSPRCLTLVPELRKDLYICTNQALVELDTFPGIRDIWWYFPNKATCGTELHQRLYSSALLTVVLCIPVDTLRSTLWLKP